MDDDLDQQLLAIANGSPPLPPTASGQKTLAEKSLAATKAARKRPAAAPHSPIDVATPVKKPSSVAPVSVEKKAAKAKKKVAPGSCDDVRRIIKNANSKAYHQAVKLAMKEGLSKDDAKARGREAGLAARKAVIASLT